MSSSEDRSAAAGSAAGAAADLPGAAAGALQRRDPRIGGRHRPLRRIAIIGTGLIGTSLGLALRALPDVDAVTGYDADPHQAATAARLGALDTVADDAADAVRDADLVVLAVPVSAVADTARSIGPALADGALLTDVASVKSTIVEALQQAAPQRVHVIGGHPMAGSHETGAAHATADLFVGATYLLTPTTYTDPLAFGRLHALLTRIGARPLAVAPERHDALVAVVSHLPQLAATTLMNLAATRAREEHAGLLLLAAGGFRDTTRIAASNPDLWLDIVAQNRVAITAVLDDYLSAVRGLRDTLAHADDDALRDLLDRAQASRRALPTKDVATGTLVELLVVIPDRPGFLAEVATTVGEVPVNIEDLSIDHAAAGGRGQLCLVVAGEDRARAARNALEARGHDVVERRR